MIELIFGSLLVPFAVYLYIKYIRTQPKIAVKTRWKYIQRKISTSPELKFVRLILDLDFSNNSSFDAHSVNLQYFTENDLNKIIPFSNGDSIESNQNKIVRINLQGEIGKDAADEHSEIEILSELLHSKNLEFKFYIEYENKYGAKYYTLVFIQKSKIQSRYYYTKYKMLKYA